MVLTAGPAPGCTVVLTAGPAPGCTMVLTPGPAPGCTMVLTPGPAPGCTMVLTPGPAPGYTVVLTLGPTPGCTVVLTPGPTPGCTAIVEEIRARSASRVCSAAAASINGGAAMNKTCGRDARKFTRAEDVGSGTVHAECVRRVSAGCEKRRASRGTVAEAHVTTALPIAVVCNSAATGVQSRLA